LFRELHELQEVCGLGLAGHKEVRVVRHEAVRKKRNLICDGSVLKLLDRQGHDNGVSEQFRTMEGACRDEVAPFARVREGPKPRRASHGPEAIASHVPKERRT
jgi:hypothetical protein